MRIAGLVLASSVMIGCGPPAGFGQRSCADTGRAVCFAIGVEAADTVLETVNGLKDDETVVLGEGTFALGGQLTVRDADGVILWGQGPGATVLDFGDQAAQSNGVDLVGDDLEVAWLTILDAKKDGLRVEDSARVHLHHLEVTWTASASSDNGAYGLYPVRSEDVLLEDCEASNASDAGIYLGQSQRAVVRNNVARGNVAGIEIENSQFVDVYGNDAEENTAGLLIFDLPLNPIVGRDIRVFDNVVRFNNTPNFAAVGATVAMLPAGTGTFAMASRRVEIFANVYRDNDTMDVGVLSGLVLTDGDIETWTLRKSDLVGADPSDLPMLQTSTLVANFQTADIHIHDNRHEGGSGDGPDASEFGLLFNLVYAGEPVDNILYDTLGESAFSPDAAAGNSNDNHICIRGNVGASFASINLAVIGADPLGDPHDVGDLYRPPPPFVPFDCDGMLTGPIAPVALPFGD